MFKQKTIFVAVLSIWFAISSALANPKAEDVHAALNVFNSALKTLKSKLRRLGAPDEYWDAYQKIEEQKDHLQKKISENPNELGEILGRFLYSLELSHLSFAKLEPGTLGFKSKPLGDGTELVVSLPNDGPAASFGLQVGDIVQKVGNLPASEAMKKGLLEDSAYSHTLVTLAPRKGESQSRILKMRVYSLSGDEENRTFFRVVEHEGEKAVVLAIDTFCEAYNPKVVHQAFEAALILAREKNQEPFLIVDLRENSGGNAHHFLRYLVKPGTTVSRRVGFKTVKASNLELQDWQKDSLSRALGRLFVPKLTLDEIRHSDVSNRQTLDRIEKGKNEYLLSRGQACQRCVQIVPSHPECELHIQPLMNVVLHRLDGFKNYVSLDEKQEGRPVQNWIEDRKKSFQNLVEKLLLEECEPSHFRNELFDRHLHVISEWYEETISQFETLLRRIVTPSNKKVVMDDSMDGFPWSDQVESKPFFFHGRIAYLVNEGTYCDAESCVLTSIDLLPSQKSKSLQEQSFYPKDIFVVGKTKGSAQTLGEKVIQSPLGVFVLDYPKEDIYTPLKQRIEGTGISGTPVRESLETDFESDTALTQALEWGRRSESK